MEKTVHLQQTVLRDVVSLLDDKDALKKLQSYIRVLKKEQEKAEEEMTAREKRAVLNDISEGLRELRLKKQGVLKSRPVAELLDEL